jgi:hypothetical protein
VLKVLKCDLVEEMYVGGSFCFYTQNLMDIHRETTNQIVHEYLEKTTMFTKFLLQSLQMGERSTVMTCEEVRPIHSCTVASLMETSLGC